MIIAELGSSHGADLGKANELIEAAAEAGADCIKFQIIYAHEILHPNTGIVDLPGGKIRLYDRFKELEVPPSFFEKLKEKVESKGLLFLCTPFGLQSAKELSDISPKCIKIASPELNFTALLREVASYKLPTLLSSGVARLGDIEEALSILKGGRYTGADDAGADRPAPVCLLHCVTAYPAPEEEYNLRVLKSFNKVFGLPVGVSDHSLDPELIPVLSVTQGASVIEKHFCLSREDSGLDDPIALEPKSFAKMAAGVRYAQGADPEETLETMRRERGDALIEKILGTGIKKLAPAEEANYERTNRSIHALREIQPGDIIKNGDIACLRTEKILRPGLPPSMEERVIGCRAAAHIPSGEGVRFEDLVSL
ncbi:MAG: N-acetylneuraminate synthase family protein [Treponema sp.]|nr:N-acetylneuraminate synthase family protein [Treponema sp.]